MKTLDYAVNLSLMRSEAGCQYIYDLANDKALTKADKIDALKQDVTDYLYETLDYGTVEDRESELQSIFNYDFLSTMFGIILRSTDWELIIDYHKE